MLRLGYKAPAEQFTPRALVEFTVHAEAVGFDSVIVSVHFARDDLRSAGCGGADLRRGRRRKCRTAGRACR